MKPETAANVLGIVVCLIVFAAMMAIGAQIPPR